MTDAVAILNRLLHAEHCGVVNRLRDAGSFTSRATAKERQIIDRMLADEVEHERGLSEAILSLRGTPDPGPAPIESGELHFLTLSLLLPRILASKAELIRIYESAGSTGVPRVDAMIKGFLENHRRHLQDLQHVSRGFATPVQSH